MGKDTSDLQHKLEDLKEEGIRLNEMLQKNQEEVKANGLTPEITEENASLLKKLQANRDAVEQAESKLQKIAEVENNDLKQRISELQNAFNTKEGTSLSDFAEMASQSKRMDYLDLQKTMKQLQTEMTRMKEEMQKELSIATVNGMTPEAANRILELQQQIEATTEEAQKTASRLEQIENNLKEKATERIQNVKQHVFGGLKKAKDGLVDKVVAGVAATTAITGRVHDANRRALEVVGVSRDTVYTNLTESVEKVSRNWMSFNYNKDRVIANAIDKVKNTLEQAYEKKANIKEALKDLGRAFIGKDRQNDKGTLSERQGSIIAKLDSLSNGLKQEMASLERNFNLSKEVSMHNLKSSKELRESAHMKESNSLDKRFEQAKEESISSKKDSAEKAAPGKNQDRSI